MIPFRSKKAMPFLYFMIFVFVLGVFLLIKVENSRMQGYNDIRNESSCNGRVERITKEGASAYIQTKNGEYYFLLNSENLNYKPKGLCDFIEIGDSIKKELLNDTLYIVREEVLYKFCLGAQIGK